MTSWRTGLALALLVCACGDDASIRDAGGDGGGRADGSRPRDGGPAFDGGPVRDGGGDTDSGPRPDGSVFAPGALRFVRNESGEHEYGQLTTLPPGFGSGDFTFELFIRPDGSFPIGPTDGGDDQLTNWSDADERPYSGSGWWFTGNFLLDGHNNASFGAGTFSLQFYGGGRLRWMVGDQGAPGSGDVWSSQAYPASSTASLLDDVWHRVALVRRGRALELWVDATMIAVETSTELTDLTRWFDGWDGFYPGQEGWFFGAEKQAAIGSISQYEDYKGDIAEMRFWTVARGAAVLAGEHDRAVTGTEPGLAGWFRFDEGSGDRACDSLDRARCMMLVRFRDDLWLDAGPVLRP